MPTPRDLRASIIRAESSEWRGAISLLGPSARAARMSSRFVRDLDAGTVTVACSAPGATGACQGPRAARVKSGEYLSAVIGFYPTEPCTTPSEMEPDDRHPRSCGRTRAHTAGFGTFRRRRRLARDVRSHGVRAARAGAGRADAVRRAGAAVHGSAVRGC